ncbi:GC-rich sequence DNA-binding factor-like protein [Abeliophyllum distichum]|uniref:GC-rich sequence DNA-binding factor-like protein n=1 Tax=Abeliophyllum distichum TaxID=126358 RepID=A0ABD1U2A9_9LAMI
MSSSKSRNFRRRADDCDDDGEEDKSSTTTQINGTSSTTKKPLATNKTKKTPSQPPTKSLLSFADDDDSSETPFSRPSSKPSSSRFSKSTHKLASVKDRIAPHPSSSSLPSNVQPQAGTYTKEALLELQKSTKTLAASSRSVARAKSKPEPEPVIVLKGLVKPADRAAPDAKSTGKPFEDDGISSVESDDAVAHFGLMELGMDSREGKEGIPDQAMIQAIRAKRERLRQAKAAAPDFIALDGGSNHGAAEGLSDEEPEFRGRIGFFGDKIDGNKKGVFEDFEDRAVPKDRGIGSGDSDEDEEDKMWEEEQVRKGLGKRIDDGIGSKGVSSSVSGNNVHQSVQQQSFGYSAGTTAVYSSAQNVGIVSSYSSIGGAVGGLFGSDVMPIAQQAELAKKALHENLMRLKESHGRTMTTLVRTDESLSASLVNVTTLENSFAGASEKFLFMQKLRDFIAVICDFLQHKAPFIEELEEQMQKLHEKRAAAIIKRRDADNDDEMSELEPAIIAARATFSKGGSNVAIMSAATAAAQAASTNARALKNLPVELDEFGRDVNLQKRMDIKRRAEARQRRGAKSDSKRMSAMDIDISYQQMEGESSTDGSDSESAAYESSRNELLQVAEKVFRLERWKKDYASSYRDAYMSLSVPAIFSPYVRVELLKWDPLHEDADFIDMKWHSLLFNYGLPEDETKIDPDDDADANLIPELVGKLAIPILHHQLAFCWDILSTRETKYAVSAMNLVFRYVDLSSSDLGKLVAVLRDRLTDAVANLMVPTWSPLEMKAVPNAARVAAYRFGTSVRLLRNICLWNKILAMPVLEKLALDDLLSGKLLPHLRSIQSDVHDAITRTERIVASLHGVWAGPSVAGDRSPKLQPLVDYLMLIGKSLEKKLASGSMETETGKLVRRVKKMLVELNEYDYARVLSRTFNLKEAL